MEVEANQSIRNGRVAVLGRVETIGEVDLSSPCVMCGKAFSGEADLRQHLKSHDGPGGEALATTQAVEAFEISIEYLSVELQLSLLEVEAVEDKHDREGLDLEIKKESLETTVELLQASQDGPRSLAGPGVEAGGVPALHRVCQAAPAPRTWPVGQEEGRESGVKIALTMPLPVRTRPQAGPSSEAQELLEECPASPRPAAGPEEVGGESGQFEMDVGPQEGYGSRSSVSQTERKYIKMLIVLHWGRG